MSAAPPDVDPRAWAEVTSEDIPLPGHDGRPLRDTVAPDLTCPTDGCGDALTGGGAKRGWILVRIVGSGDPPRRYCDAYCAARGIARTQLGHNVPPPAPVRRGNPHPPNNSQRNGSRVAALGVTPAEIRAWALAHDIACPSRGSLPSRVIDAYEEAHPERKTA